MNIPDPESTNSMFRQSLDLYENSMEEMFTLGVRIRDYVSKLELIEGQVSKQELDLFVSAGELNRFMRHVFKLIVRIRAERFNETS